MSKSDDAFYASVERRSAKWRARLARLDSNRPPRMELLKKVRAGEITLKQAQRIAIEGVK